MKSVNKIKFVATLFFIVLLFIVMPLLKIHAATTPNLGLATSFGILSSTYTNTAAGTTINGDLGYTTGPAFAPTVNGTTYTPPSSTYSTAGTDQATALTNLNSQPCTFTFAAGAIDLATDTTHGPIGVYAPGVYCTAASSAASIGTAGITLSGSGTYIFRINGALTTVANSVVTLSGASACDVFWTPTAATTLGANSTFAGTNIDASGITIGSTVLWTGRALAFGGTVSTAADTITVPICVAPTATPPPTSTSTPTPLPAATPPPTPTSTPSPSSLSNVTSLLGISASSVSTGQTIQYVVPTITEARRIDADSIFISWGPYSGTNTFIVQYGLENGKWLYSTNVTGFSTTLNDLPFNQPIWVRVAARNNLSIGVYGIAKLVRGPSLPNAGFAPINTTLSFVSQ